MSAKSRKEQLEEMLAIDPNDSFLRYGLAMEYFSAGENETAARHFHELLQLDPEYVPAYLMAGQTLLRLGDEEAARATLQAGIAVATRKGDAHTAGEMLGLLQTLG